MPASVALPFGTFERVLQDRVNAGAAKAIASAQSQLVRGPCPAAAKQALPLCHSTTSAVMPSFNIYDIEPWPCRVTLP